MGRGRGIGSRVGIYLGVFIYEENGGVFFVRLYGVRFVDYVVETYVGSRVEVEDFRRYVIRGVVCSDRVVVVFREVGSGREYGLAIFIFFCWFRRILFVFVFGLNSNSRVVNAFAFYERVLGYIRAGRFLGCLTFVGFL